MCNLTMSPSSSSSSSFSSSKPLKIGIVGFGSFAQFLAKAMLRQGHLISATSRSDYSELCAQLGILFTRDMGEFLESDHDVILLATSIVSLADVVNAMPFHRLKRPTTLFVDVLSVKEYPRDFLLQVLPKEADLLCTHPMFGPESGKDGWKDLRFVYDKVRIKDEAICFSYLQIFANEGCRMLEMSCEEHDRMAARSQLLTHIIGRILSEVDAEPTPIDTKAFEKLIQVKDTMTKDSFDLFRGLFLYNRFAREQLKTLEFAFYNVKEKLVGKTNEELDVSMYKCNL